MITFRQPLVLRARKAEFAFRTNPLRGQPADFGSERPPVEVLVDFEFEIYDDEHGLSVISSGGFVSLYAITERHNRSLQTLHSPARPSAGHDEDNPTVSSSTANIDIGVRVPADMRIINPTEIQQGCRSPSLAPVPDKKRKGLETPDVHGKRKQKKGKD